MGPATGGADAGRVITDVGPGTGGATGVGAGTRGRGAAVFAMSGTACLAGTVGLVTVVEGAAGIDAAFTREGVRLSRRSSAPARLATRAPSSSSGIRADRVSGCPGRGRRSASRFPCLPSPTCQHPYFRRSPLHEVRPSSFPSSCSRRLDLPSRASIVIIFTFSRLPACSTHSLYIVVVRQHATRRAGPCPSPDSPFRYARCTRCGEARPDTRQPTAVIDTCLCV